MFLLLENFHIFKTWKIGFLCIQSIFVKKWPKFAKSQFFVYFGAIFVQHVATSKQNVKGFWKFSLLISSLQPYLAKSSCEWSPIWLHHKIWGGEHIPLTPRAIFFMRLIISAIDEVHTISMESTCNWNHHETLVWVQKFMYQKKDPTYGIVQNLYINILVDTSFDNVGFLIWAYLSKN